MIYVQPFNALLRSHTWSTFSVVTLEGIQFLLKMIKLSSCLLDLVPTSLFLKVFDVIGHCVVEIRNCSLQSGIVFSSFKYAVINPILSGGSTLPDERDPMDPSFEVK